MIVSMLELNSSLAAIIAATIAPLAVGDPDRFTKLGDQLCFRTIGQAMDAYVRVHPVHWLD
jgi:hypothetical protein